MDFESFTLLAAIDDLATLRRLVGQLQSDA